VFVTTPLRDVLFLPFLKKGLRLSLITWSCFPEGCVVLKGSRRWQTNTARVSGHLKQPRGNHLGSQGSEFESRLKDECFLLSSSPRIILFIITPHPSISGSSAWVTEKVLRGVKSDF
jgi:hypothetical protein